MNRNFFSKTQYFPRKYAQFSKYCGKFLFHLTSFKIHQIWLFSTHNFGDVINIREQIVGGKDERRLDETNESRKQSTSEKAWNDKNYGFVGERNWTGVLSMFDEYSISVSDTRY